MNCCSFPAILARDPPSCIYVIETMQQCHNSGSASIPEEEAIECEQCKYIDVLLGFVLQTSGDECERDQCRTVRNVIYQEIMPLFKSMGTKIPHKCPFYRDRDRYVTQEEHKERDASTYWKCGYCGKAFIGELYLDMHLTNRHSDTIYKADDSVCLADFCEVFRCDVLSGSAQPTFWDVALCMEEDMQDLTQDCVDLMTSCIPESMQWNASKKLTAQLSETVCSFLTCKKYYEAPSLEEKEPPGSGYIVITVLLAVFLIIYYCVAVNYFLLGTFSDMYDSDVDAHNRSMLPHTTPIRHTELPRIQHSRNRPPTRRKQHFINTEANSQQDVFNVPSNFDIPVENVAQRGSIPNDENSWTDDSTERS